MLNHPTKPTRRTGRSWFAQKFALWSLPLGAIIIVMAFFGGNLMAGNSKTRRQSPVVEPPVAFGVAEPVYPSVPRLTPAREPETDLLITPSAKPQIAAVEKPVTNRHAAIQNPESLESSAEQQETIRIPAEDAAPMDKGGLYRLDSGSPAEPPIDPAKVYRRSGEPKRVGRIDSPGASRYVRVPQNANYGDASKPADSPKGDPWNSDTRRRYDSFFNDADFHDGHRYGGR